MIAKTIIAFPKNVRPFFSKKYKQMYLSRCDCGNVGNEELAISFAKRECVELVGLDFEVSDALVVAEVGVVGLAG